MPTDDGTLEPDLAFRVERAIADERRAFARSTATSRPEAAVLEVAGGCAVYTGHGLFSNRVMALGLREPVGHGDVDEIENFYAALGKPTEIELASVADPALIALLAERGYRLRRFRHIFARRVTDGIPPAYPGIAVEAVSEANRDQWSDTLIEGFGYEQAEAAARVKEWNRALLATPGMTAFLARIEGDRAGSASVLIDGSTAVLGGAATRNRYRRRGVQAALIGARLALAASSGCDLAVVTADPDSTSGRNSERAGFRLVCTHAVMGRAPADRTNGRPAAPSP